MCSKPNCLHNGAACTAWYRSTMLNSEASGLAQYGESIYVMKKNDTKNTFDLLRLDLAGVIQEIVFTLDVGDTTSGTWMLYCIESVYYINNTAWITAEYRYSVITELDGYIDYDRNTVSHVIMGVSLKDGSCVKLTELPDAESVGFQVDYSIQAISKDYIVFEKSWHSSKLLSSVAFEIAMRQGEFSEFSSADDPYYEYETEHNRNSKYLFTLFVLNISTSELSTFDEGERIHEYNQNGDCIAAYNKYLFNGMMNDCFLYQLCSYTTTPERTIFSSTVYMYDPANDESTLLFDIDDGSLVETSPSMRLDSSILDERIHYCEILYEEHKIAYYLYSQITSESTELYTIDWGSRFWLKGETADWFIGENYYENWDELGNRPLYRIDKQDYFDGNYDLAVKLGM
jgi:hypothetical protein